MAFAEAKNRELAELYEEVLNLAAPKGKGKVGPGGDQIEWIDQARTNHYEALGGFALPLCFPTDDRGNYEGSNWDKRRWTEVRGTGSYS